MKKIPLWKNVVLLVSLFMVIIIATLAWFVKGPRGTVEDMTIHVGKASYVQVSGDRGENWSDDLNVEIGINKNIKEVSGDGINLYAPVYDVVKNENGGFSPTIVTFDQAAAEGKYFEQVLEFRSDVTQYIYLSGESYVSAVDDQGNSYIDGAIRVAFFELDENDNEILKCIWAPNSTVEYAPDTNSFTREGSVEPYYYYQTSLTPIDPSTLVEGVADPNMVMISTAETDELGCGYDPDRKFLWSNGQNMPENAPALMMVRAAEGDGLGQNKMKVKVWLEGYDRECVSLLSGQKFTMMFQFDAQEVE